MTTSTGNCCREEDEHGQERGFPAPPPREMGSPCSLGSKAHGSELTTLANLAAYEIHPACPPRQPLPRCAKPPLDPPSSLHYEQELVTHPAPCSQGKGTTSASVFIKSCLPSY